MVGEATTGHARSISIQGLYSLDGSGCLLSIILVCTINANEKSTKGSPHTSRRLRLDIFLYTNCYSTVSILDVTPQFPWSCRLRSYQHPFGQRKLGERNRKALIEHYSFPVKVITSLRSATFIERDPVGGYSASAKWKWIDLVGRFLFDDDGSRSTESP